MERGKEERKREKARRRLLKMTVNYTLILCKKVRVIQPKLRRHIVRCIYLYKMESEFPFLAHLGLLVPIHTVSLAS